MVAILIWATRGYHFYYTLHIRNNLSSILTEADKARGFHWRSHVSLEGQTHCLVQINNWFDHRRRKNSRLGHAPQGATNQARSSNRPLPPSNYSSKGVAKATIAEGPIILDDLNDEMPQAQMEHALVKLDIPNTAASCQQPHTEALKGPGNTAELPGIKTPQPASSYQEGNQTNAALLEPQHANADIIRADQSSPQTANAQTDEESLAAPPQAETLSNPAALHEKPLSSAELRLDSSALASDENGQERSSIVEWSTEWREGQLAEFENMIDSVTSGIDKLAPLQPLPGHPLKALSKAEVCPIAHMYWWATQSASVAAAPISADREPFEGLMQQININICWWFSGNFFFEKLILECTRIALNAWALRCTVIEPMKL